MGLAFSLTLLLLDKVLYIRVFEKELCDARAVESETYSKARFLDVKGLSHFQCFFSRSRLRKFYATLPNQSPIVDQDSANDFEEPCMDPGV